MLSDRTKKEPLQAHIRWMIRRDMADVVQTEQESFEFAWTEDDFLRCLRQRNCIGMVAEVKDRVIAFMIYQLHKHRLHLLNFAVHPLYRRMGVGTLMAERLIAKLSSHRRNRIALEIRETNLIAQLFFRKQDFQGVRVIRRFYEDTGEDAFQFHFRLTHELRRQYEDAYNQFAHFED